MTEWDGMLDWTKGLEILYVCKLRLRRVVSRKVIAWVGRGRPAAKPRRALARLLGGAALGGSAVFPRLLLLQPGNAGARHRNWEANYRRTDSRCEAFGIPLQS